MMLSFCMENSDIHILYSNGLNQLNHPGSGDMSLIHSKLMANCSHI